MCFYVPGSQVTVLRTHAACHYILKLALGQYNKRALNTTEILRNVTFGPHRCHSIAYSSKKGI